MTPAARVQAAIELLDGIIAAAQGEGASADRLIAEYFRARRYAGSKDRRAVRELVYAAIRHCGEAPANGRAAMVALSADDHALLALFDGSPHAPAPPGEGEVPAGAGIVPGWLESLLRESGIEGVELAALIGRAPLDVRVNTLKADRAMIELPESGEQLAAPQGLRFATGTQIEQWDAWQAGSIEVQDHGSQLASIAAGARPGETVIDLCAGAGGKSLALAAAMDNRGRLVACDIDRTRLSRLAPRAQRAGAGMIETVLLNPGRELDGLAGLAASSDCVLVDAPCSGSGTWRRKPEAKWRLTPARLARFAQAQDRLLDIAAHLVRPGGRIVFVTCSLLDVEGSERITGFLARHSGWRAQIPELPLGRRRGEGLRLTPYHDGTDGFFLAKLVFPC